MPFETKLKARARPRRAPMRSSEGGCERIVPQHLFSKKFFQGENRSINRSCAICAWSPRDAGGSAWCRGDELGTNLRLTDGCLWTNRIGAQAPTFHPQKSTVVHMVIHRCESMVVGSEMSSDSAQNRRGIDPDSIRNRSGIDWRSCSIDARVEPRRHRSPTKTATAPTPAMGIGAVAVVAEGLWSYRFERCLMRAVNSWTWS